MKKLIAIFVILSIFSLPVFAKKDRASEEYLKNKRHFSILNPLVENVAEKAIKKSLKKEIGKGSYKVKFEGYTLSSMKQGVFKTLEIEGKNLDIEEIPVPYFSLKNLSDYNRIDINSDPIKIKSDMTFAYEMELVEKSINEALKQKKFEKRLQKVNRMAYPLFTLEDVRIRIRHDKVHIIMDYYLPLSSSRKVKTFMVSSDFKVVNGKIKAHNVGIDNSYGNLPLDKVTNLVNLIDPLSFTLDLMKDKKCNGRIENVKIEDNIIQIDGKIFVKGEE